MNIQQPIIIFSQPDNDDSQWVLQTAPIRYATAEGCYHGVTEPSYIVAWSPFNESIVQELCQSAGEDCYMMVDANNNTTLHDPSGAWIETLGQMTEVTADQARMLPAWTRINGRYWVAG